MSEDELTPDEYWLYMPKWRKAVIYVFIAALPFLGSIGYVNI